MKLIELIKRCEELEHKYGNKIVKGEVYIADNTPDMEFDDNSAEFDIKKAHMTPDGIVFYEDYKNRKTPGITLSNFIALLKTKVRQFANKKVYLDGTMFEVRNKDLVEVDDIDYDDYRDYVGLKAEFLARIADGY